MNKIIPHIILLILCLCFAGHASANIMFTINVHQIKEKQDQDKIISKEENKFDVEVELGDSYFSYIKNGKKYIFDFANRRVYTIELSNKLFSDDSLFSNISFRNSEFRNRLMLGGAFKAAGIKGNPMLPVYSEHLFSIQQKDKKTELSKTEKNNLVQFSTEGKELLSFSKLGHKVTRENKKMFIKFFRYVYSGHPQILETLSSGNTIPESIRIHRYNIINENNSLSISTIKTTPTKPFSLGSYSPGILSDNPDSFSKHLNDIKYSKKINLQKYLAFLLSQANEYFREGNYLDTMLVYMEYNLASGPPLPEVFQKQRSAIIQDSRVKELITSLSPKNKKEAETHLTSLQSLMEKSIHQKHVIQILEANTQKSLGNHQKAKELFYKVLNTSPYITGAYKDLGGLYFDEYNTVLAWRCWDIARKIAPNNKMLNQINVSAK